MRKIFLLCGIYILSINSLFAQNNTILNQISKDQDRQQREELKRNDLVPQKAKTTLDFTTEEPKELKTNGYCIDIYTTNIESDLNLLPATDLYKRLENRCIDVNDIQTLLSDINIFYQQNNLITTRAYVPEQNIKSGTLKIVIVSGKLKGFIYSDGSNIDNRVLNAFPINEKDIINLRDLEQGVDNFNLPSSQKGKIKLIPAENQGESYIEIEQMLSKPWKINLAFDNSGYETTGKYKGAFGFSYDNLLNSNDTLNLSINSNLDKRHQDKRAISNNIFYSIPYKDWIFSYAYNNHRYHRIIEGVNQSYYVNGYSYSNNFTINRLLYRNQDSRVNLYTTLSLKKSKNYIENFEIKTQRRELTTLDIGISGDDIIYGANIFYTFGMKNGLKIFGAMNDIPGSAVVKSKLYHTKIFTQIPMLDNNLFFNSTFAAQYSPDELAGSEQFGVGGRYDVRGFHEDSLYGNSGAYLRNELETNYLIYGALKTRYFLGLDAGMVKKSETINWSDRRIVGAATGLRFRISEYLSGDFTYSRALKRPVEFESSKNQIYFNLNIAF